MARYLPNLWRSKKNHRLYVIFNVAMNTYETVPYDYQYGDSVSGPFTWEQLQNKYIEYPDQQPDLLPGI